jgi:hypothetical protein
MKNTEAFFRYARARHQIYLDRVAGLPEPWTKDPVLGRYRFTNVFRELDKTTVWFANNVRNPLRDRPEVLLATVVFRLLNRIETGRAVFCDDDLLDESSAFFEFARTGSIKPLKKAIVTRLGHKGPYVTGAYIISSPPGYTKLDGMLEILRRFYTGNQYTEIDPKSLITMGWQNMAECLAKNRGHVNLEDVWDWLSRFDYLGSFHSYEIVTDLRHTALLENATDIMTWANPGPGARRGLNRVLGKPYKDKSLKREELILGMQRLLVLSQDARMWPKPSKDWPAWEMREVEHSLCEWDKMERVRLGQGKPRGVFR